MLVILGCKVEIANDGREAVDVLARSACDLVLMDWQMSVMDGFETTQAIRHREQQDGTDQHIPIIALTANTMEGDRERCLAAGIDDFLAKPFTLEQLRNVLARWLPHQ